MTQREDYIYKRLIELACIAETRKLDPVEVGEELRLIEELKELGKFSFIKDK